MKVLICYYSTFGNVYRMAELVAEGVKEVAGAEPVTELFTTTTGGSPYGPGHVAGGDNKTPIDEHEAAICRALGRRLARIGVRLRGE